MQTETAIRICKATNKVSYEHRGEANRMAASLTDNGRKVPGMAYPCVHCLGFHVAKFKHRDGRRK